MLQEATSGIQALDTNERLDLSLSLRCGLQDRLDLRCGLWDMRRRSRSHSPCCGVRTGLRIVTGCNNCCNSRVNSRTGLRIRVAVLQRCRRYLLVTCHVAAESDLGRNLVVDDIGQVNTGLQEDALAESAMHSPVGHMKTFEQTANGFANVLRLLAFDLVKLLRSGLDARVSGHASPGRPG